MHIWYSHYYMMLMFWISILFELLIVAVPPIWRWRSVIAAGALTTLSFWFGATIVQEPSKIVFLLMFVSIFRAFNLLKITKATIHESYLKQVTRRTSLSFIGISVILVVLHNLVTIQYLSQLVLPWALLQFVVAMSILAVTTKNLQKTKHHQSRHFYTDKELPTVTVAIPARNETNDMAACLRTVLANDYPKLEVLVLDDCSQDRTAEAIKDFAHDGVRFISGSTPKDHWLAKNQAYEELSKHASGEIILFCGVDVRFGPQAIRSLVTSMLNKDRKMLSVMPFRIGGGVNTSLIQPLRYWWELALPRRLFNRPPVLSTCWLIYRKTLEDLGSFKAVSRNIIPEGFFARELVKQDSYAFIRSDEHLDVRTVKVIEEQLATALRTYYPQLRKRPENVLVLIVAELALIGAPIAFTISMLWTGITVAGAFGAISLLLLITVHYLITSASSPLHSVIALFNMPFALLTEISLMLASMYQYEFGTVTWKGRNICIPTMHVVRRLPKLE